MPVTPARSAARTRTRPEPPDVLAAGVVTFRPGRRVLLVHRPKYDDWSFPKGKVDPGELTTAAAVREVAEETGLHVRLCLPLPGQRYPLESRPRSKTVSYWTGRVVGDDDVSGYVPNDEIDGVEWVEADEAAQRLTYERDRETLADALRVRRRTRPVVVLRHGAARSRKAWRRDDALRPLLRSGEEQAEHLVPLLAAYDVTRVVSSTSTRCVQTVQPYVDLTGWKLETRRRLTEEGLADRSVRKIVADLVDDDRGSVLCTHRPVLPHVFAALGVEDPGLAPGEMLVAHVRKGAVIGTECHLVR